MVFFLTSIIVGFEIWILNRDLIFSIGSSAFFEGASF